MPRPRLPENAKYVPATFRVMESDMKLVRRVARKKKLSLAQYFREVIMCDVRNFLKANEKA